MSWRQWLALLFLFIVYLLIGGIVFMLLESPGEELRLKELINLQQVVYDKLIYCEINETTTDINNERAEVWVQIAEQLNQPGLIQNRSYEIPKKWTLYNSFFVAVTVASTIGYGHLSPSTAAGRLFCIAFALIGIPLNGILFATLGEYFGSKFFRKEKKRSSRYFSPLCIMFFEFTLYLVPGLVIFLAIPAGIFCYVENWSYIDSFYYAFISLTTIGFGDFVAGTNNDLGRWTWVYCFFIILWIIFGLGYLVMLINIITKAFRSKPIIVLEQKMSSRIRATRKSLAQDAIALRDLVNEIKLLKVKPISRLEHTSTLDKNWEKMFKSDNALCVIDENEASGPQPVQPEVVKEDPVELLMRLATVLCTEGNDDDPNATYANLDVEETPINSVEGTGVHHETILDRIRRSFRYSSRSTSSHKKLPAKLSSATKINLHFSSNEGLEVKPNRRIPYTIESLSQQENESRNDFILNHRRGLVLEVEKPYQAIGQFKRSFSESNSRGRAIPTKSSFALNKAAASVSIINVEKPELGEDQMVEIDLNSNAGGQCESSEPRESTKEFCEILERVLVSRRNSSNEPL